MSSLSHEQLCRRFSLDDIHSATHTFDDALVIGRGGFGKVYKGTISLENGARMIVAIKRLDSSSNQGAPEFWAEIEMLSKLRHCNLVSLIGYCNDGTEMILIYEFMPQGNLDDHMHKYKTNLSWVQRLKISIGAARGLHYLHTGTGTQHRVIHRDVKSSNILLDKDYAAKVSDFGLSKIGPTNQSATYVNTFVKGTFGYLDPEYFMTGRLTRKSDVFAFGVVLFELLCGRLAVDTSLDEEQCSLAKWAQECIEEGKLYQIIDLKIKGQISPKCLKVFAQIADRCLHSQSKKRPAMAEVVVALELSLSLQEKFNNYVRPASKFAFTRMMKGFFISPEVTSAQSDTKPSGNNEDTVKYDPSLKEDGGHHHEVLSPGEMLARVDHVSAQSKTMPPNKENINQVSFPKEDNGDHHEVPPVVKNQILTHDLKMFSYSEIEYATSKFTPNMRLGAGEYGEVFKGWVNENIYSPSHPDARLAIAIKRIYRYKLQDDLKEKIVDLTFLREFNHPNLVKLLGYCFNDKILFLIYEFMENASLDAQLFTKDKAPLPWQTRVKIAVGVAEGLSFLHRTQHQVDICIKIHNIMLDRDFNPKLSDFELGNLVSGYLYMDKTIDPLYFHPNAIIRGKAHAFGVILMQILTGIRRITRHDLANMRQALNLKGESLKENFRRALDPRMLDLDDTAVECAVKLADVAFHCLDDPSCTVSQALDVLRPLYAGITQVLGGRQPSEASS